MPTKGSMVEYLPVGSQEAPQTIIAKKNFKLWNPKLHSQPSVQGSIAYFILSFDALQANNNHS